jgi:hypothetical protein
MSDTPPILDTPDCQNESQQLSEALEECIRSFTQEHQKLKSPKAAYLAKCLELEALSSTSDSSLPTSPLELRMFRTNAMEHGRILGKMRENMAKDQEAFEKAHNRAIDRLVDQLFFLLGPLLTERAKRGECSPSQSPQPEITLGQAIEDGDDRLPSSDSEHEQVVSPRKKVRRSQLISLHLCFTCSSLPSTRNRPLTIINPSNRRRQRHGKVPFALETLNLTMSIRMANRINHEPSCGTPKTTATSTSSTVAATTNSSILFSTERRISAMPITEARGRATAL